MLFKNFDDFIKYNGSRVNLFRDYIYTQYDAVNIIGYKLTVENSLRLSQTRVYSKWVCYTYYTHYKYYTLYVVLYVPFVYYRTEIIS